MFARLCCKPDKSYTPRHKFEQPSEEAKPLTEPCHKTYRVFELALRGSEVYKVVHKNGYKPCKHGGTYICAHVHSYMYSWIRVRNGNTTNAR